MPFAYDNSPDKRSVGTELIEQIKELVSHPENCDKNHWNILTLPGNDWQWEKEFYEKISPVSKASFRLEAFEYNHATYKNCVGSIQGKIGAPAYDWLNIDYKFGNVWDHLIESPANIVYLDLCGGWYPESLCTLRAFVHEHRDRLHCLIVTFAERARHSGHASQHTPEYEAFHDRVAKEEEELGKGRRSEIMRKMFLEIIQEYYPEGYQETFYCRYSNEGSKNFMVTMGVNLSGIELDRTYFVDRIEEKKKGQPKITKFGPTEPTNKAQRSLAQRMILEKFSDKEVMEAAGINRGQLAGAKAVLKKASNREMARILKDNKDVQTLVESAALVMPDEVVKTKLNDDTLLRSLGETFGTAKFTELEFLLHAKAHFAFQHYKEENWIEPIPGYESSFRLTAKYIKEIGIPLADKTRSKLEAVTTLRR
jgi:hypothetical protein